MRDPVEHALTANLAAEHRKRHPDPARIAALRQQIKDRTTEEFVRKALATAPPLSAVAAPASPPCCPRQAVMDRPRGRPAGTARRPQEPRTAAAEQSGTLPSGYP